MILDQLVLENIGVFAGRNEIDLTPPSPDKPVVLIGGLNGAGKTTILETIHLALYGSLAEGSSRRTGSYESYLRSLIHQSARAGAAASVELAFHAHREGISRSYRIRRTWRDGTSALREQLQVSVDGVPDQALADSWAEYIEGFLPRGIAGLFFFDGEQIESLANLERSRQVLASALAALLGLDLVDRLTADLAVLRRRHRSSQLPGELHRRADDMEAALERARKHEHDAFDALAEARTAQARAAKLCAEAAGKYRANGGDLYDQRQEFERRAIDLRKQFDSIDDELREIASGAAPFLLIEEALRTLAEQARHESDAVRERVVLDVLGDRDTGLLNELGRAGAGASVVEIVSAFLEADRDQRGEAAAMDQITGLADPVSVEFLIGRVVPDARRKLRVLATRRQETQAELESAERLLASIPDPEALSPFRASYEEACEELSRAETEAARAEERHRTLAEQRERAAAAYERAVDEVTHASLAVDDERRLVDHADRVRSTLDALKSAVARRHVNRIASLVLDSLLTLMRKENLITEIYIDPITYAVELRGAAGQDLNSEQLSVGERQMLAVALLWGLARSAGQPLPVVIDTPLGRLDSAHRRRLLDRYFPHASHQVILLSTDTEINDEAWRQLAPHIGRTYHLEFDSSVEATTVRSGYFWGS